MASRLVSQHKRNRWRVSIAKRWQLASCHHLLPMACQSGAPWESKEAEANQTCDWLWCCGWEIMDHLHNSSDLVPNDFHLFGCLKKHLVGKRFATDASVQLSSPDYRHLTPVSSMLGYKHWCHGGTDALYVNADYMGVWYVPCMHQSQLKVLRNRVFFLPIFWNSFFLLLLWNMLTIVPEGERKGLKRLPIKTT